MAPGLDHSMGGTRGTDLDPVNVSNNPRMQCRSYLTLSTPVHCNSYVMDVPATRLQCNRGCVDGEHTFCATQAMRWDDPTCKLSSIGKFPRSKSRVYTTSSIHGRRRPPSADQRQMCCRQANQPARSHRCAVVKRAEHRSQRLETKSTMWRPRSPMRLLVSPSIPELTEQLVTARTCSYSNEKFESYSKPSLLGLYLS